MIWIQVAVYDKYAGLPSVNYSISNETNLTAPVSYYAEYFLYYHLEEKPTMRIVLDGL